MADKDSSRTKRTRETSGVYFAVKSKNDIYYQMASIYQQATEERSDLAKQIFLNSLMGHLSNISLEKSF